MFNLKPLLSSNHKLQLMSNQQQPHTPNNSNKSHLTLNQLPSLTLNNRTKPINLYNKLHQKLSFKQNGQNNNFKDQNIQNFITTVQNIIETWHHKMILQWKKHFVHHVVGYWWDWLDCWLWCLVFCVDWESFVVVHLILLYHQEVLVKTRLQLLLQQDHNNLLHLLNLLNQLAQSVLNNQSHPYHQHIQTVTLTQ